MTFTNTLNAGNKHQELSVLLDFYDGELHFLEERLREVVMRNTGHEAMMEAEHFQNQFIIQTRNLEEMMLRLINYKHLAYLDSAEHAGKMDNRLLTEIIALENDVHDFEKVVLELRSQYKQFLLKWM